MGIVTSRRLAFHHAEFFSYKKHWLAITTPIFKKDAKFENLTKKSCLNNGHGVKLPILIFFAIHSDVSYTILDIVYLYSY